MADTILAPFQKKVFDVFSQFSGNFSKFYLTGGTALSDFYLHHRYSEDIDLFTEAREVHVPSMTVFIKHAKQLLHAVSVSYVQFLGLHDRYWK